MDTICASLLGFTLGFGERGEACVKLRADAANQYPWHIPERCAGAACQRLSELAALTPHSGTHSSGTEKGRGLGSGERTLGVPANG